MSQSLDYLDFLVSIINIGVIKQIVSGYRVSKNNSLIESFWRNKRELDFSVKSLLNYLGRDSETQIAFTSI